MEEAEHRSKVTLNSVSKTCLDFLPSDSFLKTKLQSVMWIRTVVFTRHTVLFHETNLPISDNIEKEQNSKKVQQLKSYSEVKPRCFRTDENIALGFSSLGSVFFFRLNICWTMLSFYLHLCWQCIPSGSFSFNR